MRKRYAVLIVVMLVATVVFAQTEIMRIVVFDLTPKSQEVSADSSMLSEMLRNEFIKTGRFEVVSREQTDRILSEAQFQGSGITSEAGAIQIGKLLNVRRAIIGSVGTVGGTVFVTVQLFDLETGRFITAESMEAPSMKDIVAKIKGTVAVLTNAIYKTAGVAAPAPATDEAAAAQSKGGPKTSPKAAAPGVYPGTINWIGFGTMAVGAGAVAVGRFVFDAAAVASYEAAITAKAAYDSADLGSDFSALWAVYQGHLSDVDANTMLRLASYIAGGVLVAGGAVLAILPPAAPEAALAPKGSGWFISAVPGGAFVTLSY